MLQSVDVYKVIVIGDLSVGKTSIALRLNGNDFNPNIPATIGAAFLKLEKNGVVFELWDTAGQERFLSLVPMYSRGSHAILCVYDQSNENTYNNLINKWLPSIKGDIGGDTLVYFISNKCDIPDHNNVNSRAKQAAAYFKYKYFATSAKEGTGITELFNDLILSLVSVRVKESGVNIIQDQKEPSRCHC